MAVVLKGAVKLYYLMNEDIADYRTENWPLIRSPWPGLFILALYLMTVLKWLPHYMENRPPYDLRKLINIYNAVQIACCTYIAYQGLKLGWLNHYKLICQPLDDGPLAVEYAWKVCYFYFVLKLVDLLDTIFFILRKKQNQVSFLHVYHHFGMCIISWSCVKWVPGGHATSLLVINSFVHIIMYSYYMFTSWDEKYRQSLRWKKHVTQIQIAQFAIVLLHFIALALAPECLFPRQPAYVIIPQTLFIFILFSDFYYKTYIKSEPKKIKQN